MDKEVASTQMRSTEVEDEQKARDDSAACEEVDYKRISFWLLCIIFVLLLVCTSSMPREYKQMLTSIVAILAIGSFKFATHTCDNEKKNGCARGADTEDEDVEMTLFTPSSVDKQIVKYGDGCDCGFVHETNVTQEIKPERRYIYPICNALCICPSR